MTIKGEIPDRNPNIMSTDEMRFWIREFLLKPEYGWTEYAGAAALGELFYPQDRKSGASSLRSKLRISWIYEGERGHFHRTIRAILDGRVVFDRQTRRGKWVEHPVPLKLSARCFQWRLTRDGLKVTQHAITPQFKPKMPSFQDVFKDVRVLGPKKGRGVPGL